MPLRYRHGYAAGIHHGLRTGDMEPVEEFPEPSGSGTHRCPAHIRQVGAGGIDLRGFQMLVHSRYTFSSRSPDPRPSDGAGPSRLCQGCCPPSPSFQGSGCPQLLYACCDRPTVVSFHHHTVQWRLVALDIGHP